ncbi:hypothetical protein FS837_001177 [Tulasnella sp. UAMH 9824]|nr:hypothetical protein FS837_001177 [Tulasnella sp. UAMH 9824]
MSTYVDSDSIKRTFFQTNSWGNEPNSSNMKRRVQVSFYGRAVYVYGPPQAQLDKLPGHIQISLNGLVMATIDLETKYREENDEPWSPQLMYHWEGAGGDASHTLEIGLLDDATGFWPWFPVRGFGFDSVVYTSLEPWRPPKYELSISEKLENITIHDTNFFASFTPRYAWEKSISPMASSEGIRTFHGTSNERAFSSRDAGVTPVAEFPAKCKDLLVSAALAVYGASPAQIESTFAGGFRHGHVQLCEGRHCEYIDVHQAYLNVPEHLWNEPVLLYSTDRMSPAVSEAVTMRLLDSWSPVGNLWTMTLSHAICSQVMRKSQWTHPIPDGHYSDHLVQYHQLEYTPSFFFGIFSPWIWMNLYSLAAAEPWSWFFGLSGEMPSWSTVVHGHDIKIFIPFPTRFPASRYANVRCCIDGECHYPDVEQWYLKALDAESSIPLVHYHDLDPFRGHHISMTAVRKDDEIGDKIIAVSRIEHQQVAIVPKPSQPPPTPSQPTESTGLPPAELPPKNPDDDVWAFALAALAVVIIMSIGWCVALCVLKEQNRSVPERRRLINNSLPPQPGAVPSYPCIRPPRPKLPAFEPRLSPASDPASQGPSSSQNAYPGSSSASHYYNYGAATGSNTGWTANTNSHHHDQRPISPSTTDNRLVRFNPDVTIYPNRIVQLPHEAVQSGHRPVSPLYSTTNTASADSPSQSSSSGFRPTLQNTHPASPTQTYSDMPPPYSDRNAPPSYDACIASNAVVGSPPRLHDPITVPAPPPPHLPEPPTQSSAIPERIDESVETRGTRGRTRRNNQHGLAPGPAEGSSGRGRGRPRQYQEPTLEATDPSLASAEVPNSNRGRGPGRGRGRGGGSGRGRSRGRRGRGGAST